ncbi:unnamed protein product, partial [Ectocarpus sp. 12 AP-2014]
QAPPTEHHGHARVSKKKPQFRFGSPRHASMALIQAEAHTFRREWRVWFVALRVVVFLRYAREGKAVTEVLVHVPTFCITTTTTTITTTTRRHGRVSFSFLVQLWSPMALYLA